MKVNLVVAQGVHEGKTIPVLVSEFLIGRDPHCQLRPASPAISKQHCAIIVREDKVFVRDYGSTNGTFINGEQVSGERELVLNDRMKAGPLEFFVRWEQTESPSKAPGSAKPAAASGVTPPGSKSSAGTAKPKPVPDKPAEAPKPAAAPAEEQDPDQLAAMLLGMDDGDISSEATAESSIPDGTTVMDIPAVPGQTPAKKDEKKPNPNNADTSSAAAAILSKYMRRPRT